MKKTRWTTSSHAVFNLNYHMVWCPKYRRKVLVEKIKDRLIALLLEKAKELGVSIEKMEVMPDQVHLFIKASAVFAPHYIAAQL